MARLLGVAQTVEPLFEPVDVILRQFTFHFQLAGPVHLDQVAARVEVEVVVAVPVFPHAPALRPTQRPAAQAGRRGDVQDVRVHDLLQVASGIDAGVL